MGELEFQIITWHAEDIDIQDTTSSDEESDSSLPNKKKKWTPKIDKSQFTITIFGKDHEDKTYALNVNGFTPYFYVKLPDHCTKKHKKVMHNWLYDEISPKFKDSLLKSSFVKRHSFRNFDNKKLYKFVRFKFSSKKAMRHAVGKFQIRSKTISKNYFQKVVETYIDKERFNELFATKGYNLTELEIKSQLELLENIDINGLLSRITNKFSSKKSKLEPKLIKISDISPQKCIYELHENMVDPLIKFIHHADIETVSWIKIRDSAYTSITNNTTCDYTYECNWKSVKKGKDKGNTKIKIMAYDIECDSSHGDFPMPIKDYTKLSRDIFMLFIKLHKQNEIDDKYLFTKKCLKNAFNKNTEDISMVYLKKHQHKPSKSIINMLSRQICELLVPYPGKNTIELKQHNTRQINGINRILNHRKTFEEVRDSYITNVIETDDTMDEWKKDKWLDDPQKFKWEYYRLLHTFPDKDDEFIGHRELKQLLEICDNEELTEDLENPLPEIEGDHTIQIGLSFLNYGSKEPYKNYMLTLKGCHELIDAETLCFKSEKKLLLMFRKIIQNENPDIITGWNTDGFDTPWLFKRAEELKIIETFSKISKFKDFHSKIKIKQKKGPTGELVKVEYVETIGRIQMDLLPLVRVGYSLGSYKLDRVAANFIRGPVKQIKYDEVNDISKIFTKNILGLNDKNFIIFNIMDGYLDNEYMDGKKFEISNLDSNHGSFCVNGKVDIDLSTECYWCLGKDDVSPKDIFRLQSGTDSDRYIIAKYCMMDVILCIELLNKLELLTNNIGMANVCKNPLSWIIHRGQGIKILSLVSYYLKSKNYLMPYLYKDSFDNEKYEGAVVLDPNPGIYIDRPIAVLDYSSLYPSSMIEVNLSHETLVSNSEYLGEDGGKQLDEMGYDYEDVVYDRYKYNYTPAGAVKSKEKIGEKQVRYVQYRDGSKGLIPQILEHLLSARKNTRKKIKYKTITIDDCKYSGLYDAVKGEIKTEDGVETIDTSAIESIVDTYNDFEKKVLDGLQLAFKITANSLYGQIGAKTSDIYYKEIAASTTAVGRDRLLIAKEFAIDTTNYPHKLDNGETIYLKNKITYGDTDSIFVEFQCLDGEGNRLTGRDARKKSIELAIYTEKKIQATILRAPQNLEYEKTFDPFILLSKKRYVGNLYEMDPDKYKRKSMGIVLKRRDNAPIVKVIYGGIIDIIMKEKNIRPATTFLRRSLRELAKGKYPMNSLIITKTLSSFYKDPERIAHKVLADRIGERDPGNKPRVNDRIPYVYVIRDKEVKLQGDRIEDPTFIKEHNLKPDYEFYITNQIRKPVSQIFALCLEELPGFTKKIAEFDNLYTKQLEKGKSKNDASKYMLERKGREAGNILFRDILRYLDNKKNNNTIITDYFRSV